MNKPKLLTKALFALGVISSLTLFLQSCSDVEIVKQVDDTPYIAFSALDINVTKATEITGDNVKDYTFSTYAYQVDNTTEVAKSFYNATGSAVDLRYAAGEWETYVNNTIAHYYWPIQTQKIGTTNPTASLSFFVFGPQTAASSHSLAFQAPDLTAWGTGSRPSLTFEIPSSVSKHVDLLAAADQGRTWDKSKTSEQNRIAVTMKHLCSQVVLKVCSDNAASSRQFKITTVKIGDLYYKGKASFSTGTSISIDNTSSDKISWSYANPGTLTDPTDTLSMNSLILLPQVINTDAKLSVEFNVPINSVEYPLKKSIALKGLGGISEYKMGYRYIYVAKIDATGELAITVTVRPWDEISAYVLTPGGKPTDWD
jgi:hypothetical protein